MAEQQPATLNGPLYEPVPLPAPLGGIVLDKPADQLEDHQLASASNMLIRDGIVQQRGGYSSLVGANIGSIPLGLYEWIPFDGSARLVMETYNGFAYYDATAATPGWAVLAAAGPTAPSADTVVVFTPMRTASSGLRLITTNGVDPPYWWSGNTASTFVYISTAVIGLAADVWRSHYVLGDVTTTADGHLGARVQWSALGDPTTWTGTASTGTLDLLDSNASKIQLFMAMRGTELVYKEEGVHALAYKGSPFYFVQTLVHAHLTCISRRAVAPVFNGDQHVVVTKENIILWDGQNIDRIGDPIRKDFFTNLNWSGASRIWVYYSSLTEEVFVALPEGSSVHPSAIWIFNLRYGSWWKTDLSGFLTMVETKKIFTSPKLLSAKINGNTHELLVGSLDSTAGTTISSSMQWKLFDFGRPGQQKGIRRVTAVIDTGTGTTTTVTLSRAIAEQPLATLAFDTGNTLTSINANKELVADAKVTAKYMSFRLTHTAAGETVRVRGLVPWVDLGPKERKNRE